MNQITYEAWRITYQSSEQAARAAYERMVELEGLAAVISEADRLELTGALGLLRGHQYHGSADALARVLCGAELQAVPSEKSAWCAYVATMLGCYLGWSLDDPREKALAGIIERRLWALPTAQSAVTCGAEAQPDAIKALKRCALVLAGEDTAKGALIQALEAAREVLQGVGVGGAEKQPQGPQNKQGGV